jgi:hypothetical protein
MPWYYVNKNAQNDGYHEVHETGCEQGAHTANQDSLGWHMDCAGAVAKAKDSYTYVDGCFYCSEACHTR